MKPHLSFYDPERLHIAFRIYYSVTIWPKTGSYFGQLPNMSVYAESLEPDGMRLLEHLNEGRQLKLLVSVKPELSPEFVVQRSKGRLSYLLRQMSGVRLSRKVSLRSIGSNRRNDVEQYISKQVIKEGFVDEKYCERLDAYTSKIPSYDFTKPSMNKRGAYWYDLHIVLVREYRQQFLRAFEFDEVRNSFLACLSENRLSLNSYSIMPDHLHTALRGRSSLSPLDIGCEIMNRTSGAFGRALWQKGMYLGTFGEYDIEAIRQIISRKPTGQARGGY